MELQKIWEILRRRRWLFGGVFLIVFCTFIIGTYLLPSTYKATALVLIEDSEAITILMSTLNLLQENAVVSDSTEEYETDIALATTRPLLKKLISSLQLKDRHGKEMTPEKLTKSSFVVNKIFPQPYVSVNQYEDSAMLEILATFSDQTEVVKIANTLAELYIKERIGINKKEFKAIQEFLETTIIKTREVYWQTLSEIKDLRIRERSLDGEVETEYMAEYINSLKTKIADLVIDVAASSVDYTEEHPDFQELEKKLESTRELLQIQQETSRLPQILFEDTKLQNKLELYEGVYQNLLNFLINVGMVESMDLSNIRLIDPATIPVKPHFPKKILNYALGVILGLFGGLALVLFVDYIDTTIHSLGQLKLLYPALNIMGIVPKTRRLAHAKTICHLSPVSPAVEIYRTIRNNIRYLTQGKALKTLAIISYLPGEGKSSFASNIAISFSRGGSRVIAVDLNLRRPSIHKFFDLSNDKGITSVLASELSLKDAIIRSEIKGLDILPSGPPPPDPGNLIESQGIKDIVKTLKERYDLIIIDTPPIISGDDPISLGKYAQGVVLVTRSSKISASMIEDAINIMSNAGLNLLGIILNQFEGKSPGS